MKILTSSLAILLFLAMPCLANKKKPSDDNSPSPLLVSAVTPATQAGTGTITVAGGTPFVIDAYSRIVIDGAPATMAQVKIGMRVLTQSAPGTTFGEIDLKTMPTTMKKRRNNANK